MTNIRWGWIVLAAFLGELTGILLLMGLRLLHGYGPLSPSPLSGPGEAAFIAELFAVLALFGYWVARKAPLQPVLHGLLVGVTSVLIYEVLVFIVARGQPIPRNLLYFAAHAVKIAGGAAGGWFAARQHLRARSSTAIP